jgi:hypothetical protein
MYKGKGDYSSKELYWLTKIMEEGMDIADLLSVILEYEDKIKELEAKLEQPTIEHFSAEFLAK